MEAKKKSTARRIFIYVGLCLITYLILSKIYEKWNTIHKINFNLGSSAKALREQSQIAYDDWIGEVRLSILKDRADSLTKNAYLQFSSDKRYTASILYIVDLDVEHCLLEGNSDLEGMPLYKTGLKINDAKTNTTIDLLDEVCPNNMLIDTITWNLHSNLLYISESYPFLNNGCVYEFNPTTKLLRFITGGSFRYIIADGEYKDYLVVSTSDCAEEGGRYWYDTAVSPDGKIKIIEPYFE